MALYPNYKDIHERLIKDYEAGEDYRKTEAQYRAQMQVERYQEEQLRASKAYTLSSAGEDFPIKFIPQDDANFQTFHKLQERKRGESWIKNFRIKVAVVTILGLIGYLIIALIERN